MLIKKEFQGQLPENKIVNTYNNSQTDAYACNYINEELYYKPGDTFRFNYSATILSALITNSTKDLIFTITTPKSLKYISSITANSVKAEIRGIKGYLNSTSGFNEYIGKSGYTTNVFISTDNMFVVRVVKSSAWTNVDNNTPAEINLDTSSYFTFN